MPRAGIKKREEGAGESAHRLKITRGEDFDDDVEDEPQGGHSEEGKGVVKADKDYMAVAGRVLNSVEDEKSRQYAGQVLGTQNAQKMYHDMRKAGMSNGQTTIYLKHALGDIAQGKNMSFKAYARAVAEDIAQTGNYVEALDAMRDDELISKEDHRKYVLKLKKRMDDRQTGASSMLERIASKEAAVWLFMAVGAILVLLSGFTMTGAATGSAFEVTILFVIGLALFIMGLVLKVKK